MDLGNVVRNVQRFTDEEILAVVKKSQDPNERFFLKVDDVESQNIYNMCAFHRPGLLPILTTLGCKPHVATRFSKNPLIEALFEENVEYAKYLVINGYFIFYDSEHCLFKFDDKRFEDDNLGFIDIIDALYKHGRLNSIEFIKNIVDNDTLICRDKNKHMYYVTK